MGVPKRKTSKMRLRTRKASHHWRAAKVVSCPRCGARVLPHTACTSCGYYKGRLVLCAGKSLA
ncbi:MAG: 50S ribosomal protein L32 [Candidatus Xiphinematobacter sp.]|nr:MAG: 50S ribosomal protein L32 [Candidatus Xiphinematobacter sp.]QQY09326.1 MAG: 50S ribosomal protein L32 [Candidatus Xiphinematobacter sp.]QQY11555.1 MAG: 50S ribosomal protein L32 [Candidatus Xiphinematobacter sp.]